MSEVYPETPLGSPTPEAPDSERYPYAQDLDGRWHRRPPGDEWVISIEHTNCRTACGLAIHSVHVSEYEPEADPSTGSTLCQCVTTPPARDPRPVGVRAATGAGASRDAGSARLRRVRPLVPPGASAPQ